MRYNINKLSRDLFPWFWQNKTNLEFIDLLMSVFSNVNSDTEEFESDTRQRVKYSIQRLSLEISLNDKFDNSQRRIKIQNGTLGGTEFVFNRAENPLPEDIIYIFNRAESTPPSEDTPYVYNIGEVATGATTNFTVFVPSSLTSQEPQIRTWIELVLMFGIQYEIEYLS